MFTGFPTFIPFALNSCPSSQSNSSSLLLCMIYGFELPGWISMNEIIHFKVYVRITAYSKHLIKMVIVIITMIMLTRAIRLYEDEVSNTLIFKSPQILKFHCRNWDFHINISISY